MNMIENIRRIGIFMIAAQTVMHFAAGKKYERYLKIIAGIIILLQFIAPFVSTSGDFAAQWMTAIEQMEEQMKRQSNAWQEMPYAVSPVETIALQRIEEELTARLNGIITDYGCEVEDVEIDLEQINDGMGFGVDAGSQSWSFRRVKVILQRSNRADSSDTYDSYTYDDRTIQIEEITVGHEEEADKERSELPDANRNVEMQEYRHLFAQALGISDEKVEVICHGEW